MTSLRNILILCACAATLAAACSAPMPEVGSTTQPFSLQKASPTPQTTNANPCVIGLAQFDTGDPETWATYTNPSQYSIRYPAFGVPDFATSSDSVTLR